MLEVPDYVVPVFAGVAGALLCLWVVLRLVPKNWRLEFIISGFLGGGIGYWLWMDVLGPALLPR